MRLKNFWSADFPSLIVVFLVALPLCLGVAVASDAPLFSGLLAGIIGGIVVGSLSGSPLSVSGPAAGLTSIVAAATALTIAIVASLETLLSIKACDKLDPFKRRTPLNRELKAQGAASLFVRDVGRTTSYFSYRTQFFELQQRCTDKGVSDIARRYPVARFFVYFECVTNDSPLLPGGYTCNDRI